VRGQHHVSGLLAAQGEAAGAELFQNVAIADRGGAHRNADVAHGQVQAEVAHHRGDQRVLGELAGVPHGDGQHGHDVVAVDDPAVGVHRQAAVGVAVVRNAQVGAVLADGVAQRTEVGRADALVDVQPVRLGVQRHHLGAGLAVGDRSDGGGGSVRAVDDDAQPGERARGGRQQVLDVAVARIGQVPDPADRRSGRARRRRVQPVLDGPFERVGQLVPAGREQLDAVVRHGVVRGGDHHTQVGTGLRDEVRDGRGGQHADPDRVGAGRREPRDDRGLEHLTAGPRVPSDQRHRPVRPVPLGQHPGGRRGQPDGELRGEELAVGQAANAVRTEQTSL
jgi:hypothetical protein